MSELILDESILEDVSGGANGLGGAGGYGEPELPMHACGFGATGKLVKIGYGAGGKIKYRCEKCKKEGTISTVPGTNKFCNLY